ncbi:MAG: PorV/PorQ family protein [Candidatus Cyclobacteriaceae bacterium M2_1C_046]
MARFFISIALLFATTFVLAQNAPKYSNEFLSIGVGSRALGMGGAVTAAADDVTAGYWNPSLLLGINADHQLSLMHAQYFNGIANYDYAGFTMGVDSVSRLGISLIRFAVDDIPDTRFLYDANGNINYDNVSSFAAADYGFLVSYARKTSFLGGVNLGGNAKVIHRSVGIFADAWGFGLDLGANLNRGKWSFGVMFRDITGTFTAWDLNEEELTPIYDQTNNTLPEDNWEVTVPRLNLGVKRDFEINEDWSALMAIDLVNTFDGKRNTLIKSDFISLDPRIGAEIGFKETAFLRLGASTFQEVTDINEDKSWTFAPSMGVGFKVSNFIVDYAFTHTGDISESLYSHIFTIRLDWNKAGE